MAARKTGLSVVKPGAKAPKADPPKSVTQAAAGGDARELLVAMRARIAIAVEDPTTPARDLAALTKRLSDIALSIGAIDARAEQEASKDAAETEDGNFDAASV
jgi:hypothetical protein